ncbi:MAG: CHRD domain-containing protein [Ignavibacteria bacterium]|nr:CHRD domain-containing protein [Ignavibacteria bacterium]
MKNFTKHLTSFLLILTVILLMQSNSFALIYPINHTLSGANENPPNVSTGTGSIAGTFDNVSKVLSFNLTFSGLLGTTTAAHFHAPAGITTNSPVRIGFAGFPTGVSSGVYNNSYVLTAQQEAWLLSDSMYVNVHSNVFPGGEIRHQLLPDAPLPVELASFVSAVNGNEVTLNWTTLKEINNTGFDIERKLSVTSDWTKAGFVEGHGTITGSNEYSFTETVSSGKYNYRLKQIDVNGNFEYFNLSNEVVVGIPESYSLSQNYPNPFNPSTKINYSIKEEGNVNITLYNIYGKEVAVILNENRTAGFYNLQFNSSGLSSGVYFYKIISGNFTDTKRMTLVK